jgi:hypothetical protein
MPNKGSSWQFQHVCVAGEDLQIRVSCNGSTVSVSYYRQQPGPTPCYPDPQPPAGTYDATYAAANPTYYDPYSYPAGSAMGNDLTSCDAQSALDWAVAHYVAP